MARIYISKELNADSPRARQAEGCPFGLEVARDQTQTMKKQTRNIGLVFAVIFFLSIAVSIKAQPGTETYTGTILSYGSRSNTRTVTSSFTLKINGSTSDEKVTGFLKLLQDGGQTDLLNGIKNENLGTFSISGNLARTVNVVREVQMDGKTRIHIAFERWTQFAEFRGGYRSLDYPFTYIELMIDPATGKGEGTYIAAAQIRWKKDKSGNGYHVEIEDFATFPARLINVKAQMSSR